MTMQALENTTIAAVATPPGTGGLSVIRVSGADAFAVCDRVFRSPKNHKLADTPTHTLRYGHVINPDTGAVLDEVLAAVMRAPHTFTTEDTVEISCHGGAVVTREVLAAVLRAGALLAAPGEFTKRAFLGGRLDLTQAEAVIDVINAKTPLALQAAGQQLNGALGERLRALRDRLLDLAAGLNVLVDYPEEDMAEQTPEDIRRTLQEVADGLRKLSDTARTGKLLREGINTVIVGKPNVGKSSLLNALLREERAIVTDVAGTTRDVVCESVDIGGVALNLYDTAGIRESGDLVEQLGIDKSREYVQNADLVLLVTDAERGLDEEDIQIGRMLNGKQVIVVLNKTDRAPGASADGLCAVLPEAAVVRLSAKTGEGLDALCAAIVKLSGVGALTADNSGALVNLRHRQAVETARERVNAAQEALAAGLPVDMLSIDILDAVQALGEATGQSVSEEMVERIFHQFCVGK